ncbi:uncharacterized protein LOC128206694 isoform X2 [Mya arenaria]|uniref:uncharacterized protein LOC128206694 isoform X2 n=1 Tax=Mya arenaria TaxID=6604 RepID=UPI0022E4F4A3|nr:uncharacterized protein LOC128206694 isoform X2 [Mya arenaria]
MVRQKRSLQAGRLSFTELRTSHRVHLLPPCDGAAGNECSKDPLAVCVDSMCVCGQGSHQVARMFKKNNVLGGWCHEGSPLTDPNSKCFHGIVHCAARFSEINGTCIKVNTHHGPDIDGVISGRCCVEEGTGCEKDPKAICVCGVCECPPGVQQVNELYRRGEKGG